MHTLLLQASFIPNQRSKWHTWLQALQSNTSKPTTMQMMSGRRMHGYKRFARASTLWSMTLQPSCPLSCSDINTDKCWVDLPTPSGRAATQQAPKEPHDHSCSEEPSSLTTMTARITAGACVRAHIHVATFQDRPADKLHIHIWRRRQYCLISY